MSDRRRTVPAQNGEEAHFAAQDASMNTLHVRTGSCGMYLPRRHASGCQQQFAPERMPDLAPFTAGSFPLTAPTDGRRILQEGHGKPEQAYFKRASLPFRHACGCSALLCRCRRSWDCSLRGSETALTMQHTAGPDAA